MIGHRDVVSDLQAMVEHELVLGFAGDEQIVEDALESFPDRDEPAVRAALAAALAARTRDERAWPATTDCDRLDQACAALEAEGVVARQNFWCCTSCAIPAITDEMMTEEARGTAVRGYVLFHSGTLENAVSGHSLALQCGGSIADDDTADARIAERVVHALKRVGLDPEWSGGRIVDVAIDWKRRRKHAPAREVKSIEEHVGAWEQAFAAACFAAIPSRRPVELGPTLVAIGDHELAARWASRSGSAEAAGRTARALAANADGARARDVLLAAYRRHPAIERRFDNVLTAVLTRDPALEYIELLLRAGLGDDAVARVASTRVSRLPPSLYSAAAKAWLACATRDAGRPISPRDEERWIGEARFMWSYDEGSPLEVHDADDARVMLAAALWSYLPAEEIEPYADTAFAWLDAEPDERPSSLARRAAFRALASNDDTESLLDDASGAAALEVLETMVEVGEAGSARPLLEKLEGDNLTLGLIAVGDRPPADVDATSEAMSRLQSSYEEGLYTSSELERSQLVAVYSLAASGEQSSAAALLAPRLEAPLMQGQEAVAATRARLDAAAGASFAIDWEKRAPQRFLDPWEPSSERRLARAREQLAALEGRGGWEAASKLRMIGSLLLKLATVDRERSSRILDDLVKQWPTNSAWRPRCVEVLMAVGRIDEALALDRSPPASRGEAETSLELARRLLLAGRGDDALERAVARMDGASLDALLEMSLLLLTLSAPEERVAVAARLRAAYDSARATLDELAPRPASGALPG
jgi:uncharacterized protein DUF6891